MKLSKIMLEALNEQIRQEYYSSYLYLSMSAYFESVSLPGFAAWMKAQVAEERMHGDKIYNFILERGGKVNLGQIDKPKTEWKSANEVFEDTCEHEAKVTSLIYNLVGISRGENDYATEAFLQWFVTEQVEEEDTVQTILDQIKMVGENNHGILMLDRELGSRTFTPPADSAE